MSYLNGFLNVAAALAIAQAIVKLLDIALDSRQKLVFQRATENVALWLIDLDPIRHYRRFSEKKVQLRWLIGVVLVLWTFSIFSLLSEYDYDFRSWWQDREVKFHGWAIVGFFLTPVLLYLPFRVVLSWLARSKNVWRMLFKVTCLASVSAVSFVAIDRYPLFEVSVRMIPVAWTLGAVLDTFILGAAIVAALYTAQAVVWLFRHLMWRIATDAKGAWSAALFVLAGILGLAAALFPKS